MKHVNTSCRAFRNEWLQGGAADPVHVGACAECTRWVRAAERQLHELANLGRLKAPAELDLRVAEELAGDHSRRYTRVLGGMARLQVPAALDELVDAGLRTVALAEGEELEALRSLETRRAPHVLERLLGEELVEPERHRAERFSGSLERMPAPHTLERRLVSTVRRRAVLRLVVAPLATLAAAGLVVWIAVRRPEPAQRSYRFEVVHAASLDGIDPLARMLAESLSGGGSAR